MMIPMGAVFAIWFVLVMVWHGIYRHMMNEMGYQNAGVVTKTIVDILKQFVPIVSFIMLDLPAYVMSWFGVVA